MARKQEISYHQESATTVDDTSCHHVVPSEYLADRGQVLLGSKHCPPGLGILQAMSFQARAIHKQFFTYLITYFFTFFKHLFHVQPRLQSCRDTRNTFLELNVIMQFGVVCVKFYKDFCGLSSMTLSLPVSPHSDIYRTPGAPGSYWYYRYYQCHKVGGEEGTTASS